jgi:DNA-binding NtrC family response regulator
MDYRDFGPGAATVSPPLERRPAGGYHGPDMSMLLIVDRDDALRSEAARFLLSLGHTVREARECTEALTLAREQPFDLLICQLPAEGSLEELLRAARTTNPGAALIAEVEPGAAAEGQKALGNGAAALLAKPYSLPELNFQVRRALELGARGRASPGLVERYQNVYRPYSFIGECPGIKKVFEIVKRVARTDSSVIITGETGTGKELVAGAIHYNSPRAGGPFVRVNCAALPEQLLESELFGHEKGSFTGADRQRVGRFEHADGGTLFLDEVADMSLFTQAKVLRVLQEKEFERLGSNVPVKTDVRILSATNRDLAERMHRGQFREDLFYRLNVVTIRLPPLRERGGDVGLLAQFFLKKFAGQTGKRLRGLTPDAQEALGRYPWPGNIRELENTMERAVLMADGELITADDLALGAHLPTPAGSPGVETAQGGDTAQGAPSGPKPGAAGHRAAEGGAHPAGDSLQESERRLVLEALQACGWVQKEAARRLGLSSRALNYRIRKLGITHPSWRQNR